MERADRTTRVAAFFDVDRTLIAGGAGFHLAAPFRRHGLVTRRQQLRAAILAAAFSLRGADDEGIERFAATARELMSGWDQQFVARVAADEIEHHIEPVVFVEALERIELHRQLGHEVYAVSATMREIVEPLAELLGLDGAIASEMEVFDGVLTGEIARPCHGEGKAQRLREFVEGRGFDLDRCYAYSDSISDEPFLSMVGRPYAVNPDRRLRELAEERGWGMLFFRRRRRMPIHHHRAARLGAAGVLLGGAALLMRRRGAAAIQQPHWGVRWVRRMGGR